MLKVLASRKTVQEIESVFNEVCARHHFGVLGSINLRQKLNDKGVPFERECLIFEVCNPLQAKKVLEANIAISVALPCRIAVYQEDGITKIATIRPTARSGYVSQSGTDAGGPGSGRGDESDHAGLGLTTKAPPLKRRSGEARNRN